MHLHSMPGIVHDTHRALCSMQRTYVALAAGIGAYHPLAVDNALEKVVEVLVATLLFTEKASKSWLGRPAARSQNPNFTG